MAKKSSGKGKPARTDKISRFIEGGSSPAAGKVRIERKTGGGKASDKKGGTESTGLKVKR